MQIEEILQEFQEGWKQKGDAFISSFLKKYQEHSEFEDIMKGVICAISEEKGMDPQKTLHWILKRAEETMLKRVQKKMNAVREHMQKQEWNQALSVLDTLLNQAETVGLKKENGFYSFPTCLDEALYDIWGKKEEETVEVTLYPMDELYNTKAFLFLNQQKFEEAQEAWKKALQWNPVHFHALNGWMITCLQSGDMETYRTLLRKMHQIITSRTEQAIYCEKLALDFLSQDQIREAVVCFNAGIAWNPEYQGNRIGLQNLEKDGIRPFSEEEMNETLIACQHVLQPCQETIDQLKKAAETCLYEKKKEAALEIYTNLYQWIQDEDCKNQIEKLTRTKKKTSGKKAVKKQKKLHQKQHNNK